MTYVRHGGKLKKETSGGGMIKKRERDGMCSADALNVR
jgi:hypothetical protein